MRKKYNVISQILGFIGAFLAFLDSWRTASRFTEDGVRFGFGPEYSTGFWNYCDVFGFILIAVAFLIQLILAITEKAK